MCFKFMCIIFVLSSCFEVKAYSKVNRITTNNNGSDSSEDGPKIHRAFNMDLIIPNESSTSNDPELDSVNREEATGRASQHTESFSFPFMNPHFRQPTPRIRQYSPEITRPSSSYPVYRPQPPSRAEIDKMKGKGEAMDRYTPGEAVATSYYKGNNNKGYNYKNPPDKYTYNPPKDIYSFPPNSGTSYSPSDTTSSDKIKPGVSSYLPPAAGPADSFGGFNGFIGPVSPEYLPPYMRNMPPPNEMSKTPMTSETMDKDEPKDDMNGGDISNMQTPPPDSMDNHEHDHPPPNASEDQIMPGPMPTNGQMMPGPMQMSEEMMPGPMPMNNMDANNDDMPDHDHNHDDNHDHNHDHHDHISWDSFPTFLNGHSFDMSPDIIYDDHHHHPFPHPADLMTTTTTERPEPRVKKYSYFYIGRKLWYIPLYFTVWFSFYILWLILKSIARHKVNLPNHYTGSNRRKRNIDEMTHKEITDHIDLLTIKTMAQIEAFKNKYL